MATIRFGANGWLARFDAGFDDAHVVRAADALGLLWADKHPGSTILVGRDERYRAAHFAQLVGEVLASYGLRVKVSEGPGPTPALAWCTAHDDACAGAVMLTASESSCEYGGILVRGADGGSVSASFLTTLNRLVPSAETRDRGPVEHADFVTPYIDALVSEVDAQAIRDAHLKVVADPMYGAAIQTIGPLLKRLGCEVTLLHSESQPDFVGIHPVPDEPWVDKCERQVVEQGASCGIVMDGDADRATMIDEKGRLVSRHDFVPLLASHLVNNRGEQGRMVVTSATSARSTRQAELLGLPLTVVPVGFERIYDELQENDVLIGSEEYGGVCVPAHLRERDGIFACVLALELMAQTGLPLSVLVEEQTALLGSMTYKQKNLKLDGGALQRLRNILPGINPRSFGGKAPSRVSHADGVRAELPDGAWGLLRVSRTAPVARAYAEASTIEECEMLLKEACDFARERY